MPGRGADQSGLALAPAGPDEWRTWRALRRAALAEAPGAFGSTLAEWSGAGDTEDRWRERLAGVALNLVARIAGHAVGMASGTAPVGGEVQLISMWVAPEARGKRVGEALIEAVAEWATDQGATQLALSVREHNDKAIALYRRCRFADDGPAPDDPASERRMVRPLPPPRPGDAGYARRL